MKVKITTPYIELQQLLKITSWIDSCGEAKIAVKKLNIKVEGVKEDRRGRKIYPGSVVEVEKSQYEVC